MVRGFVNPYICFVAGTQVVVGVEANDEPTGSSSASTALRTSVRYVTKSIEAIAEGELILAKDQHNPLAEPTLHRVDAIYRRISDHLRILTLRDSGGREQTLRTTDDHPFWIVGEGWANARMLLPGDRLLEADGFWTQVVSTVREEYPNGVPVFNFRVEEAHTYFVRQQESKAEPVWVHNADYTITANARSGRRRLNTGRRSLQKEYPGASVQTERYLRDANGRRLIDPLTGEARRVDLAVFDNGEVVDMVEVTSLMANKSAQIAKEGRIRATGKTFIRDRNTRKLVEVTDIHTRIMRVK